MVEAEALQYLGAGPIHYPNYLIPLKAEALQHLEAGNTFYQKGWYEEACEEYANAKRKNSSSVDANAYKNWGNSLIFLKRHNAAISKYQNAENLNPKVESSIYYNWGDVLVHFKNYNAAIDKYKKAIDIGDLDSSLYANLFYRWGNAFHFLNEYEKAIEKYKIATEINPDYLIAYYNWGVTLQRLKKYEEAIDKYKKAIKIEPYNRYAVYAIYNIADILWEIGMFPASWIEMEKAYEGFEEREKDIFLFSWDEIPGNGSERLIDFLRYNFGVTKVSEEDIEIVDAGETIGISKSLLKIRLNNLFNWEKITENGNSRLIQFLRQNFGIKWIKKAKIEALANGQTIRIFTGKNSLSLRLNDEKTKVTLKIDDGRTENFIVRMEKGKLNIYSNKAILTINDEIRYRFNVKMENTKLNLYKDSNDSKYFLYFGSMLHEVFCEYKMAEEIYRKGLNLDTNDVEIWANLAKLYIDMDEEIYDKTIAYCKAHEAYRKAETILKYQVKKTEDADIFLQLGKLYLGMEEYDYAEKYLSNATEMDRELAEPFINLGIIYIYKQYFKKGIQCFKDAFQRDRENLIIQSNLAESYLKAGDAYMAESGYNKILCITDYHVESHIGLGEVYTNMGDKGDEDMYARAIDHFTKWKGSHHRLPIHFEYGRFTPWVTHQLYERFTP